MMQELLRNLGLVRDSNVSVSNRLIDASFLSEEDIQRARAEIAKIRAKLDKKAGADKIEKEKCLTN